jgi:transposase
MGKNPYVRRAKISTAKFRRFLRYFAMDMEATKIAALTGLNRNTVNRLATALRRRMAEACDRESAELESMAWSTPRVYAEPVLRRRRGRSSECVLLSALPNRHVHSDLAVCYPSSETSERHDQPGSREAEGRDKPALRREFRRLSSPEPQRARLLDSFWGLATQRLAKFKGVPRSTLRLHLKECEFRFNHREDDLYQVLLNLVRQNPLS